MCMYFSMLISVLEKELEQSLVVVVSRPTLTELIAQQDLLQQLIGKHILHLNI